MGGASPSKHLRQKGENQIALVGRLPLSVGRAIGVVRFVPHVPRENALVAGEGADYPLNVDFQARILRRIQEDGLPRSLHPPRVVHTGNGRTLRTESWLRV